MLPKKKRITKEVFHNVMKNGKIFYNPLFTLYFIGSDNPKYSFVVPKKIAKSAVTRNKNKRRGYNIMRQISPKLGTGIFIFKKEALLVSTINLKSNIENLLKIAIN